MKPAEIVFLDDAAFHLRHFIGLDVGTRQVPGQPDYKVQEPVTVIRLFDPAASSRCLSITSRVPAETVLNKLREAYELFGRKK